MAKNIDIEIHRLLTIKEEINAFNRMKEWYPNIVPISLSKYNELLSNNYLDKETFYYVIAKNIGQYIDGYLDGKTNF